METSRLTFCWGFLFVSLLVATCGAQKFEVPRDCPPNEFFTVCGDNCQTECATLGEPCKYNNYFKCPDGCYCNKGFARNAKRECIPIEKCEKKN